MKIFISLFAIVTVLAPFVASAQVPMVNSFTASRTSMNSGEYIGFSWDLSNAGGYSFIVYCVTGIKIKNLFGAVYACDTADATTLVVDDARDLQIYNVSGSSATLRGRITPKDSAGVDYSTAMREVSFTVATHSKTITSFTSSVAVTEPFTPFTIMWAAPILNGVNLRIECVNGVSARSTAYTATYNMPCNKPIFIPDLAASGSMTISFSNAYSSSQKVKLTLLPAMAPGAYDGTHEVSLELVVASDVIPDPVVTSLTASSSIVASGQSVILSWISTNALGINMRIGCNTLITATSSQNLEIPLVCGSYAFDTLLAPSGSLALGFNSSSTLNQTVSVTAIPAKKITGTYDATRGQSLTLTVKPRGVVTLTPPPPPLAPPPAQGGQASTSTLEGLPPVSILPPPPPAAVSPAPVKFVFTQNMAKGSRSSQVTPLQQYLARDPALYPEGIVSGYFGTLTEKAVQRFQKKYGIASSGTPSTTGYGAVGPKTRAKLNEVQ